MATMVRPGVQRARDRGVGPAGLAYWLSAALAVAAAAASLLTFTQPAITGIGIAEILLAWRWQHASATSSTTGR